jgi:phospholipid/cholesterol/gamma-HCH transport system substrate-binding protein
MRISHGLLAPLRLLTVIAFAVLCALIFGFLWTNSGGKIPLVTPAAYQVTAQLRDVDNLVGLSNVRVAGVDVGRVGEVTVDGGVARVALEIDPGTAPLHEGATVTVKNKTLIEESYLQIVDGTGAELDSGAVLPEDAATSSVQVDDVLASLDQPTREALGSTIRGAAASTDGRRDDIGAAVGGLGTVGREGSTTLTALADQSEGLRSLTTSTATLLTALDTRRGQIAQLVDDSRTVFGAVADSRDGVERVMRSLPPVLDTARDASSSLETLAGSLAPVARNLNEAAAPLSGALQELPATSADLRGLLPSLDRTLDGAPETLNRAPTVADDLSALAPTVQVNLSDINPMLAFVSPYGRDVAGFFANFAQVLGVSGDGNGRALRTYFIYNEESLNTPVPMPFDKTNAVPAPGTAGDPNPQGPSGWQRLEREPLPG